MRWGRGLALLWGLLGTVPALLCPRCDVTGCRPAPCPSPLVCRRTTLRTLKDGVESWRQESGCDVAGPPEVAIHFRSHGELVTLREERWGEGPKGGSPAPDTAPPPSGAARGPGLCPTCDSSDGSCGRPPELLPCPHPGDRCIDVISRGPAGVGEGRLRGCGRAGSCPGILGFDTGSGRGAELRCWESSQYELEAPPPSGLRCWGCDGPSPTGCAPHPLPCGGGRTRCVLARSLGPSGEPWLIRGCATPEWCQTPVGLGGLWGGSVGQNFSMGQENPVGLSCCQGDFCNSLPGDPSPPSTAPPPLAPLPLLLLLLLLAAPQV